MYSTQFAHAGHRSLTCCLNTPSLSGGRVPPLPSGSVTCHGFMLWLGWPFWLKWPPNSFPCSLPACIAWRCSISCPPLTAEGGSSANPRQHGLVGEVGAWPSPRRDSEQVVSQVVAVPLYGNRSSCVPLCLNKSANHILVLSALP